ncbi:MAG: NADP-dependent oxidoreductase [Verrucomicrobia bacterium]|nr:NADP-dependent oxidoreductase [Verrucomicrobiota bacterium]
MKAMVIEEFGSSVQPFLKEVPRPVALDNEVLIKVAYAGVNPVDGKIKAGYLTGAIPHEFPLILGWDAAGTVAEVGKNVKNFKVGDEVFAYVRKPILQWGAYAEYVAFDAQNVAKKPRGISFAQAAALPLVSLTAWQSLFDAAHLKKGETVLIHAASGGVGSMAVQFAKNAGAQVITTASRKKHDYVKKLGADLLIDYQKEDFADRLPRSVDVVFDTVGGETFQKSLACLKKGGRIVSILQRDLTEAEQKGIEAHYVFVSPSGPELHTIAQLIEQKKVVPPHIEEMDLREAGAALNKLQAGQVLGKIVLKI